MWNRNDGKTTQTTVIAPMTSIPVSLRVELNFSESDTTLRESDKETITKAVREALLSNEFQTRVSTALLLNIPPKTPEKICKCHLALTDADGRDDPETMQLIDTIANAVELKFITKFTLDNPQISKLLDEAAEYVVGKIMHAQTVKKEEKNNDRI